MLQDRRLATRHCFHGTVEVVNLQSGRKIVALGRDLNLFGVFVRAAIPFIQGTEVRVRFSLDGSEIVAVAEVAYSKLEGGMGIVFDAITREGKMALEGWLSESEEKEAITRRSA